DMAHARALFQPFRRMHSASQFEGSGIGLSMVQRIVQHHGGEVRVRSQAGVGTVAEFTLDPAD
ncbi:MAG: ATP-binding protein, partial [Hydrogenophaga sp.]|nr:ATP-binding protein [Hydrogenophaga sp.]